jgi:hypothetical protein
MAYKLGSLHNDEWAKHVYGNLFRHETHPEWSRVTIAPSEKQIPLMLEIARQWSGPYGILYVLTLSRLGHREARHQSPQPCTFEDLELFAYTFQEYFEGDGRHHLWFANVPGSGHLVYDNHDLIYSYGRDDEVMSLLKSKGFTDGDPQIPRPHVHCYNQEFDADEDEIMKYFAWIESPLREEQGDS